MKVLLERFPYRYVESGTLENGMPDYRIQKANSWTKRYSDMYLLDNKMQLMTAIDDFEYTKWLDPEGVPCYIKDSVSSQNQPWSGYPLILDSMIEFDDIELLQLKFCMSETKKMMAHPSEHERHASISKKVDDEMERRKQATGAYTREGLLRQLEEDIKRLSQSRKD